MRSTIIAGNWKMNLLRAHAAELVSALQRELRGAQDVNVVVFPPYTALHMVNEVLKGGSFIHLGGQDVHAEEKGAFTGEVSAEMLRDAGCTHVLVGHSERRHLAGETDEIVNRKVHAAFRGGLFPIVCVGETLAEREAGQVDEVLARQVRGSLAGLSANHFPRFAIAYEPVWAIGTGKNASPQQAAEAHGLIRRRLGELHDAYAASTAPILYGGSVTADNAAALLAETEIDGALVGGASLTAESFIRIVRAREAVSK